ncbi:MAG: 4-alpha-glucanotransferase, partial [Candidatus Omnitrophica bacterium]|nr:4-alpha-glucanotransferase [Candidatus Omnitrophota bacterium]
ELPFGWPLGCHRLEWNMPGVSWETWLISTSSHAFSPGKTGRGWGLFAPLYALHSRRSWGAGDLGDLRQFLEWTASRGGTMVGTLPLLPVFLDQPFDPSPYAPVSRLFWNEFYLDLTRAPEVAACPETQRLLRSSGFVRRIDSLRRDALVDYRHQMALKRRVLEIAARFLFGNSSPRRDDFSRFMQAHPEVEDYSYFRAVHEAQQSPWSTWPERLRRREWRTGDYLEESRRYHLYAQWVAHEQMENLAAEARRRGVSLYLDLPLGVHAEGYDVWRRRDLFVLEADGGAPPDPGFPSGQNWGFPPMHPEKMRAEGYGYLRAVLRHHLQLAGALRLDHVMGLHRLYWIPHGQSAADGVYVRYPAGELYALLCLESQRQQVIMVGENLGTVPPVVNTALKRHRARQSFVVQYELLSGQCSALRSVPSLAVASMNTHDMPPFNAFWQGLDLDEQSRLGIVDKARAKQQKQQRRLIKQQLIRFLSNQGRLKTSRPNAEAVLEACLAHLSAAKVEWVLVNLEDMWLEIAPQNVPSTAQGA